MKNIGGKTKNSMQVQGFIITIQAIWATPY